MHLIWLLSFKLSPIITCSHPNCPLISYQLKVIVIWVYYNTTWHYIAILVSFGIVYLIWPIPWDIFTSVTEPCIWPMVGSATMLIINDILTCKTKIKLTHCHGAVVIQKYWYAMFPPKGWWINYLDVSFIVGSKSHANVCVISYKSYIHNNIVKGFSINIHIYTPPPLYSKEVLLVYMEGNLDLWISLLKKRRFTPTA